MWNDSEKKERYQTYRSAYKDRTSSMLRRERTDRPSYAGQDHKELREIENLFGTETDETNEP
jgi:hypothetical protein